MSSHSKSVEVHGEGVKARIGLWLFLLSEILLFGGMFLLYSMYRYKSPADFHAASMELSRFDGTLNTVVLLTSSLTVVVALHSLHVKRNMRRAAIFIAATIALGLTFLVVKSFEWGGQVRARSVPGGEVPGEPAPRLHPVLRPVLHDDRPARAARHYRNDGPGVRAQFRAARQGHGGPINIMENGALYRHLVDIIWIFLFPLFI